MAGSSESNACLSCPVASHRRSSSCHLFGPLHAYPQSDPRFEAVCALLAVAPPAGEARRNFARSLVRLGGSVLAWHKHPLVLVCIQTH